MIAVVIPSIQRCIPTPNMHYRACMYAKAPSVFRGPKSHECNMCMYVQACQPLI